MKTNNAPFRWLVLVKETTHEFACDSWTSSYESSPILQYWDGEKYVNVPFVRENYAAFVDNR